MDKIPLDDDKLDLSADHVHPITISVMQANSIIDQNDDQDFGDMLTEALNYMEGSGNDAVIVITIKKD